MFSLGVLTEIYIQLLFFTLSFAHKKSLLYRKLFKPLLDFLLALFGCILLFPVFIFVAIFLAIANRDNPFFLQHRPGKNGRLFKIIKFKTMSDARDAEGRLLSDSKRLTTIGGMVRKTSIDEIPQLINVLKGDMSLVGPRPLLPEYLPLFSERQQRRHEVKPGITGYAQVNGRNAISWTQKLEYDVCYVEQLSFNLDVKILIKTFKKVLASEGINSANMATTKRFNGKN